MSHSRDEQAAVRAAKDIAYGSAAGIASKIFEHPFDLTKVRLQSQVLDAEARFSGPIDCLTKTWRNEGIRGLYRGLPAPIVGAMAENASLFLSYRELQELLKRVNRQSIDEPSSMSQVALSAAGAGAITSLVLTPIELVKCKMQVQMLTIPAAASGIPQQLPGPFAVFMSVVRNTGIRGLWLGQMGTFIRGRKTTTPNGAGLTSASAKELQLWESAFSGACAGVSFNLVCFPADTTKSLLQTEEDLRKVVSPGKPAPKSTFMSTFMSIYRAQGLKGLYAGCGITIARSIPSSAIIFLIYDSLSKRFG
ncbi:mitochondrial carrier domain-containing protein [Favolaschia claudopus]|uniref:Mitochondrial carrier domain-containing protein n=1 Tax=Favolaschia claudopus TaxID=2862362 RepID=A0AAW0BEE4_9AGAR